MGEGQQEQWGGAAGAKGEGQQEQWGRGSRSNGGGAAGAMGEGQQEQWGRGSRSKGGGAATHSTVVAVDVCGALLPSDGVQLHSGVVVGKDIVVAVLAAGGWQSGSITGEGLGHLNGTKLLKKQLVVVGPHHQQLVHKAINWHGRMAL